jgi:hypothetical protein
MKKTYSSPRLTEYGTVNQLTQIHGLPTAQDYSLDGSGIVPGSEGQGSSNGEVG